ncbi:MAG TPA: glycosyltransferase [Terriglobales bacterium]|nr:glycosyltransferase [Terriglobales bacterium]
MPSSMDMTVVICTHDRSTSLRATLGSFSRLVTPDGLRWELLVVDNNSMDDTRQVVEGFAQNSSVSVRYTFEPEQGKSVALNRGVSEARGRFIAFTDDDVSVDPGWLMALKSTFDEYKCLGIAGRVVPLWQGPRPSWLEMEGQQAIVNFDFGSEPRESERPPLGANAAFARMAFEKYGFFRTDLGPSGSQRGITSEDTEFGHRLLRAGEKIIYAPTAVVYHPVEPQRATKTFFQRWFYNDGRTSIRVEGWPETASTYLGIPRWLLRGLAENVVRWTTSLNGNRRFHFKLRTLRSLGAIVEAYRISHGRVRRNPSTLSARSGWNDEIRRQV